MVITHINFATGYFHVNVIGENHSQYIMTKKVILTLFQMRNYHLNFLILNISNHQAQVNHHLQMQPIGLTLQKMVRSIEEILTPCHNLQAQVGTILDIYLKII